ncbi:hypothetical protein V8C37DRAFT_364873 [Trichoderma ceciliae]
MYAMFPVCSPKDNLATNRQISCQVGDHWRTPAVVCLFFFLDFLLHMPDEYAESVTIMSKALLRDGNSGVKLQLVRLKNTHNMFGHEQHWSAEIAYLL